MIEEVLRRVGEKQHRLDSAPYRDTAQKLAWMTKQQRALWLRNRRPPAPGLLKALLQLAEGLRHVDARALVRTSEAAVDVAERLSPDEWPARVVADLRAEAKGKLANGLRVLGKNEEAAEGWVECHELRKQGTGDPVLQSQLYADEASLYLDRQESTSAIGLLNRSANSCEALSRNQTGELRIKLGRAYAQSAEWEKALREGVTGGLLIDATTAPVNKLVALHNVTVYLVHMEQWDEALLLLTATESAYRRLAQPLLWLRHQWLEGQAAFKLGRNTRALEALRTAYAGFSDKGMDFDAALVALDISILLMTAGWWKDLQEFMTAARVHLESKALTRQARRLLTNFSVRVHTGEVNIEHAFLLKTFLARSGSRR